MRNPVLRINYFLLIISLSLSFTDILYAQVGLGTELLVPAVAKEIVSPAAEDTPQMPPPGEIPEEFQFMPPEEFQRQMTEPKSFAVSLETMGVLPASLSNKGTLGPAGMKIMFNVSEKFAAILGIGGWNTAATAGNTSVYNNQINYLSMLRFGGKAYGCFGMNIRTTEEGATQTIGGAGGTVNQVNGTATAPGFVGMFGIESGRRRGLFFFFEVGYAYYIVPTPITVTDGSLELTIASPAENGMVYSAGIGRYIR